MKNKQTIVNLLCRLLSIYICIVIAGLSFVIVSPVHAFEALEIEGKGYIKYSPADIQLILTEPLLLEKCYECHADMYPNLAYDPNDPNSPNCSCFKSPSGLPYPIDYSSLPYNPNLNLPSVNPSTSFIAKYEESKKGHLSHIVYQPFGLGRRCLDCHDTTRYQQSDPNGHNIYASVYFKDGKTLDYTKVCTDCHGGFYPEGSLVSVDPNIENINPVKALKWGDPSTVTCLQCHDDSYEHGGIYASYLSRYSSMDFNVIFDPNHIHFYHDWMYDECIVTAPDPDKVPGQNYWSKNGHGIMSEKTYAGATLDTGYPDPNKPKKGYPNNGAMNSSNIPLDQGHSRSHDLDLDSDDGEKNFCWECHWSNSLVKEKVCLPSNEYPAGIPIGKYNGHLDTVDYRDERWGDPESDETSAPHHQWKECRECHPTKYSHFVYKTPNIRRNSLNDFPRNSHCIVCHNPHGSGDEYGIANLFMIKGRIYKNPCNNCHFSQFQTAPCSPYPPPNFIGSPHADPNKPGEDYWVVNFQNPLHQDTREEGTGINSPDIPANSKDICEVCHQDKDKSLWPAPGKKDGYRHQNGSRHYFNLDNNYCPSPNSDPDYCTTDYRGTDCTGCHVHDPPISKGDKESDISNFNSKAFAPTCRCHGIGLIDIETLTYEEYWGEGDKPDIAGKGHGIPPPPFPDGSITQDPDTDPHTAHAWYNFPCLRCHINPDGPSYDDPNMDYIFMLDNNTPVGFDAFLNPNGSYDEATRSCTNLYCHSNGKGEYAGPIAWSDSDRFCRDPDTCSDEDYSCNQCHKNPPVTPPGAAAGIPSEDVVTDHSLCPDTSCELCHPHNGKFEGDGGFYKHVNGNVDVSMSAYTFGSIGCGCCHYDIDPNFHPSDFTEPDDCLDCHYGHAEIYDIDESLCQECHLDTLVETRYLHNNFNLPGEPSCEECHSMFHEEGITTFFAEYDEATIEGKCKVCHNFDTSANITVSNNTTITHKANENCLRCHDVLDEEINQGQRKFKAGKHYDPAIPTRLENMERSWTDQNGFLGDECSVCHGEDIISPFDPSVKLHDNVIPNCNDCHGNHNDMDIEPDWDMPGSCGDCHYDITLPGGGEFHTQVQNRPCDDCHGSHKSASTLRGYLNDSSICEDCHGSPPDLTVECGGQTVSGVHPPEATNCQACHPAVYSDNENHFDSGPPTIVQSWAGANSCGICHIDNPIVKCGGIPSTIHAQLGPSSNCAACHNNHCDMAYGNDPGKCIACHSPNPLICDICGPRSIATHYAFDTMGINQAKIQDCLSCHVEPIGGGEANPAEHINNPQTFVREGACLGCHSLARIRHGPTDAMGCYACHPMHCVTEYARNDACIWCHTANPPIVDICQIGMGVTTHMALDSSVFNQIQVTNCIGCHVEPITGGEANPINHIDDPMTYVNPLTCMGCHTVVVPHGASGIPWEGGLWPTVNCYSCHPKHCFTLYCDNQACVWCHTPTPPLQNVCGKPGLVPHSGDCINCHAAGAPTGGECNTIDHMNGITYVRDGTCLGCHANVTSTHGPGTEACALCHPVHCAFTYCSEPQCKACHNQPVFNIVSDYGCGIGLHDAPAYKECNRCHTGECNPQNHTLGPTDPGMPTDLSGMQPSWIDCGLCHAEDQAYHATCSAPCTLCHTGSNIHACQNLDYCAENKCKCCHASAAFPINSDYGCGTGMHAPEAYINCTMCHINECGALNHMDTVTDISNMPLDWATCGLCHKDDQATHIPCNQPCTSCHSGTGNHACLDLNYCSEPQCKCCHAESVFPINSDYGCGTGTHDASAYIDCTICHIGECSSLNHLNGMTDVSNMPLDWTTCGLCHAEAQQTHINCPEPCTVCHSGTGNHSCLDLDYCAETGCKCCHIDASFPITSDYGCGTGTHPAAAYVDCTMCHVGECSAINHFDDLTDVSNMPLSWSACGLCHVDAQATHINCPEPCNVCHSGTSNHSCLDLDYCAETRCKCCHIDDSFPITSDYGCGTGTHQAGAYVDCTRCHIAECTVSNHLDGITDVSNMPLNWNTCGLCHVDTQASHANCPEPCTLCHSGASPHACTDLDYCNDQKCRCCHIDVPYHLGTPCDCSTCHSAECDPLEHDVTGTSDIHPMNPLYYNYTGTSANVGCDCCHPYPPQCVCVGISDTQDHCLDLANGCSEEIFECAPCHTPFNRQPDHIQIVYGTPAVIASCACHGDALATTGAHTKHLITPVMIPVYDTTENVIDCKACHSANTNLSDHVICVPGAGVTAPVQFDAVLPMIGQIDSYTPGTTPGSGSCNLYCHSDGIVDPLDTAGTYFYYPPGSPPPYWTQGPGLISCGNPTIGYTENIYQCHDYPPPSHDILGGGGGGGGGVPGGGGGVPGGGGAGIDNCTKCHPTPILGTSPDNTFHINGVEDVTMGGGFPGGGGVGGGIPVI